MSNISNIINYIHVHKISLLTLIRKYGTFIILCNDLHNNFIVNIILGRGHAHELEINGFKQNFVTLNKDHWFEGCLGVTQ